MKDQDIAELEAAFMAFAKVTINLLMDAKVIPSEAWSSQLQGVAGKLRENQSFQSAYLMERLADFAEDFGKRQQLRDSPGNGGLQ